MKTIRPRTFKKYIYVCINTEKVIGMHKYELYDFTFDFPIEARKSYIFGGYIHNDCCFLSFHDYKFIKQLVL